MIANIHKCNLSMLSNQSYIYQDIQLSNNSRYSDRHQSQRNPRQPFLKEHLNTSEDSNKTKDKERFGLTSENENKQLIDLIRLMQPKSMQTKKVSVLTHFQTKFKLVQSDFTEIKSADVLFVPFSRYIVGGKCNANLYLMNKLSAKIAIDFPAYLCRLIQKINNCSRQETIYHIKAARLQNYDTIYLSDTTLHLQESFQDHLKNLIRKLFLKAKETSCERIVIPEFEYQDVDRNRMFLCLIHNILQSISFHYSLRKKSVPIKEIILCSSEGERVKEWGRLISDNYYRAK